MVNQTNTPKRERRPFLREAASRSGVFVLCLMMWAGCSAESPAAVDQLNVSTRSPELGALDVSNNVVLSFSLNKQEPGRFGVVQGIRHTAGVPVVSFVFQGVDAQNFVTVESVLWPGPGTHVHLVALNPDGQVLVDPLLEYEVLSLDTSPQDAGTSGADANSDGASND